MNSAFNLLGQTSGSAAPLHLRAGDTPSLQIAWGSYRQSWRSSIWAVLTGPRASGKFLNGAYFRDCWVERRIPVRALVAAGLWHIVFIAMPWPQLPASSRKTEALENFQLTWSGPINDLPALKMTSASPAPTARTEPAKTVVSPSETSEGEAFHPRQRIFTDAERLTHPRQTLINKAAAAEPPKILPNLPNIVQLQASSAPARPRIEINEQSLAKLRPRERQASALNITPAPEVSNAEQKPANINIAASPSTPARPKLELSAGAAPRIAQEKKAVDAGPAPDVGGQRVGSSTEKAATFIALSAMPGPLAPIAPPQGNLAARVAISPEGKPGATGASAAAPADVKSSASTGTESAAKKSSATVSISGGNPVAKSSVSGLGSAPSPKLNTPSVHGLNIKVDPRVQMEDIPVRTGPPNFAALPPGAKPEQVFASKKVYTMYVNMPNLNSATGSWLLNFSELRVNPDGPRMVSEDLSGPSPLKKSDPKYPPTLINERVEGEVVLYAVIRPDGSVDSIQLVRGLDEQLDNNAMQALSQWKFRPASRAGEPVALEAIVHIPFHAPADK